MSDQSSVLVVVAHPDDEVLGFGATGAALAAAGVPVRACILSGAAEQRGMRPTDEELRADILTAQELLGFQKPIVGSFPNISFNTVSHIDLVQFIEAAIMETGADTLVTHHPADTNDDHTCTSRACQAAARLFQRRSNIASLRSLRFMEVPSSTDWSFAASGSSFIPDTFVYAGLTLEKKIAALRAYRGVMRDYPHPRSEAALRALAAVRGAQAGLDHAEAFQTALQRIECVAVF